jgi:hypothetical protein
VSASGYQRKTSAAVTVTSGSNGGGSLTWTAVSDTTFGSSIILGIAYGGGTFVAVGESSTAAYSTNGISWTAVSNTTFGSSPIYGIAYGNGKFVAVGYSGEMAYSNNQE